MLDAKCNGPLQKNTNCLNVHNATIHCMLQQNLWLVWSNEYHPRALWHEVTKQIWAEQWPAMRKWFESWLFLFVLIDNLHGIMPWIIPLCCPDNWRQNNYCMELNSLRSSFYWHNGLIGSKIIFSNLKTYGKQRRLCSAKKRTKRNFNLMFRKRMCGFGMEILPELSWTPLVSLIGKRETLDQCTDFSGGTLAQSTRTCILIIQERE